MISRQRPALKWSNGEKLNFKRLDRCPPNILEALLTIAPTSNLVSIFGLSSRDDFYAVFTDELKFFIKKNPREFENDASLIKKMKLHLMSCGLLLQEEQITTGGDDTFEFRPFLDLLPPPFDEKIEEKVLHTIANLTLALERDANTEKVKNNTQNFDFLNDLLDENSFASRIRLADKNFAREQEIDFLKLFDEFGQFLRILGIFLGFFMFFWHFFMFF